MDLNPGVDIKFWMDELTDQWNDEQMENLIHVHVAKASLINREYYVRVFRYHVYQAKPETVKKW